MQPTEDALVFIVDDDAGVREALAWLLRSRHLPSQSFESADDFAQFLQVDSQAWQPKQPGCLLLDVRMPGMSGLALFEQLKEKQLLDVLPVIFLTGHADVPTAVDSVKRGAFDFCEKPFSDNALVAFSADASSTKNQAKPASQSGGLDRTRTRCDAFGD
jgi:two-component system, LuxR family, response regulator DctR